MEFFNFFPDQPHQNLSFRCSSKPRLARKRKYQQDDNQVSTELTLSYKKHKPGPPPKIINGSIESATSLFCEEEDNAFLFPSVTRNLLDGSCLYSEIKKEPKEYDEEGEGGSEISTELTLSCFQPKIMSHHHHHKMMSDHEEKPKVRVRVSNESSSCVFDAEPISVFVPPPTGDVWKIKKRLTVSDLGNNSRLLVHTVAVNKHVLPLLGREEAEKVRESKEGIKVRVWDCDTSDDNKEHELVFKRWSSSKGYVFVNGWIPKFVTRRSLEEGDMVGLFWDVPNSRFNFSLLQRAHQSRIN